MMHVYFVPTARGFFFFPGEPPLYIIYLHVRTLFSISDSNVFKFFSGIIDSMAFYM